MKKTVRQLLSEGWTIEQILARVKADRRAKESVPRGTVTKHLIERRRGNVVAWAEQVDVGAGAVALLESPRMKAATRDDHAIAYGVITRRCKEMLLERRIIGLERSLRERTANAIIETGLCGQSELIKGRVRQMIESKRRAFVQGA